MRLLALLVTGLLAATPATAQQAEPSRASTTSFSDADARVDRALDLPVSLDKIRDALVQPSTVTLLKGLTDTPMFRMEIRARQKIEELLATLDFKSGPTPPGGLYGYEQQRLVFPAVSYPLAQPYAAFNTGQLLTVAAENLAGKALGGRLGDSFSKAQRQRAQIAARRVVDEAIADYCASKPNAGAGIQLCETQPIDR